MRNSISSLLLFAVLIITLDARAQSERKQPELTGSISGRVTFGGKPAPGVKVVAFKHESPSQQQPAASAKTDQDGHFQLNKLPSDHYRILALAPAYIASEQAEPERPGKAVSLAEGETIEGLDFALIRGSVITGRITDEDGQPITGEMITLFQLDPKGEKRPLFYFGWLTQFDFGTDDQGNYRIFGLPPGRYLVSAGAEPEQVGRHVGGPRYRPRTFYPGVSDESKAGLVELTTGSEATGIDIAFGQSLKTYSASGRIIDGNTGRPVPDAQFGYGIIEEDGGSFSRGLSADARGNFRLNGLLPGTFYITATIEEESGLYSSVASFQIKDQDVTGLEIKIRRGSIISGMLAVEGANVTEAVEKLSKLKLWAGISSPDIIRGADDSSRTSAVSLDGGFRITGLHPGKISLNLVSGSNSKGFSISRVEREGVEYRDGIEVGPGEQVAGVRVILGYANGRIRGQVKIEGGKLPPDARISIFAYRVGAPSGEPSPQVEIDPNGRFVAENLLAGEYIISVNAYPPSPPGGGMIRPISRGVTKKISVTNGAESEVMIVLELIAKNKEQ